MWSQVVWFQVPGLINTSPLILDRPSKPNLSEPFFFFHLSHRDVNASLPQNCSTVPRKWCMGKFDIHEALTEIWRLIILWEKKRIIILWPMFPQPPESSAGCLRPARGSEGSDHSFPCREVSFHESLLPPGGCSYHIATNFPGNDQVFWLEKAAETAPPSPWYLKLSWNWAIDSGTFGAGESAHVGQGGDGFLLLPAWTRLPAEEPAACQVAGSLVATLLWHL